MPNDNKQLKRESYSKKIKNKITRREREKIKQTIRECFNLRMKLLIILIILKTLK